MDIAIFNIHNYHEICDWLCKKDVAIKEIIAKYGYPPLWQRTPNFETLIHIILEQQVSLASANAAFQKLKQLIHYVTAEKILSLTDEQLKACYFSKQKKICAKDLAQKVQNGVIILEELNVLTDAAILHELKKVKGIGDWTATVYLMMALHRSNLFPAGDIALINSIKYEKNLSSNTTAETIIELANEWKPYRTVASFVFWWSYINRKNIQWHP
ncbi:MAG: DNA-3-methyladenine glycosylase family protein [Chitinophagaceae bacterium]